MPRFSIVCSPSRCRRVTRLGRVRADCDAVCARFFECHAAHLALVDLGGARTLLAIPLRKDGDFQGRLLSIARRRAHTATRRSRC
jgi:hypothetical protein